MSRLSRLGSTPVTVLYGTVVGRSKVIGVGEAWVGVSGVGGESEAVRRQARLRSRTNAVKGKMSLIVFMAEKTPQSAAWR
jgi:hypothetical protein